MGEVVYAETFGNPSEVWMWRQVRALGVPLLTHEHRNAATFPYEHVAVVPPRPTARSPPRGGSAFATATGCRH